MSRRATRDISRSNARNIRANDSPEKENIGRNLPLDGIFAQIRHQSDERKDPLPCPERPRKDLHGLYAPDARFPLARGRMPLRALSESTDATRNRRIQFDRGRDQTARERALLVLGARTIARLLESGVLSWKPATHDSTASSLSGAPRRSRGASSACRKNTTRQKPAARQKACLKGIPLSGRSRNPLRPGR